MKHSTASLLHITLFTLFSTAAVGAATIVGGSGNPNWIGDMDGLTKVTGGDIYVNSDDTGSPGIRNQAEFSDNNGDWWNLVDIGGNNVLQRGSTQENLDRGAGFLFDSPGFSQAVLALDHNFGAVDGTQWASLSIKVWGFTSETALDNIKGDWSVIENNGGNDLDLILDVSLTDPGTAGSTFESATFDTSPYVALGFSVQAITVGGNQSPTGAYPWVDNVAITVVPEPSAAVLLLGAFGVLLLRRRRG